MNHVVLIPATPDQEPILANLLELYAHDFSEFHPIELGPDGRYGYAKLPLYWREPDRYPFLILVSGELAGLALVRKVSPTVWDFSEFFVVRRYRRLGIGTRVAQEVLRKFTGSWQVRVMKSNTAALPFWERLIAAFVGKPVQPVSAENWLVFQFRSRSS